jgi:hypothetical protein
MQQKTCECCGKQKNLVYFKKFTTTRKVRYSAKCLDCKGEHDKRKRAERKREREGMMPFSCNPY